MIIREWQRIDAFSSPMEFKRFVRWIETQVSEGVCREIGDIDQKNEWADREFLCKESGEVWILRQPDPGYFSGSWSPE